MSSRDLLLILAVIVLGVLTYRMRSGGSEPPPAPVQVSPLPMATGYQSCGEVVERCNATAVLQVKPCEKSVIREKIVAILSQPMETAECMQLRAKLKGGCPAGCSTKESSYVIVPGSLTIESSSATDSSGGCLARGIRPVTVKGECRRWLGPGPEPQY